MTDGHYNIDKLLDLARDKSVESRKTLVDTIADLFSAQNDILTERERALMTEILRKLVQDFETTLRGELSERLAGQNVAPPDLIVMLANDEIEVARPVLLSSTILQDEQLIEIIRHRTLQHQLAIAMRSVVSEVVADALVETDSPDVITTLLKNPNAKISEATMAYLVDQARKVDRYQEPILNRRDLPPSLAKRMFWWVSAALRNHILDHYSIEPNQLDDELEAMVNELSQDLNGETGAVSPAQTLAHQLAENDALSTPLLIQTLRAGEVPLFEALLSEMSSIEIGRLSGILYQPGAEALSMLCCGLGIDKQNFASILLLSRKARPSESKLTPEEVNRVLSFFEQLQPEAAKQVLRLWQRNSDYEQAIGSLKNSQP